MTRHRCFRLVLALGLVAALAPALAQAAGAPLGRLAPANPPPDTYGRWLATRSPAAPFTAKVLYSSVPEAQPLAGDGEVPEPDVRRYLILVEQTLYPSIQGVLATYIGDVENEGFTVELIEISGGTAEDLRDLFIFEYMDPDSLEGCFLIGDLPAPWFTHPNDFGGGSSSTFPCELYLMDMDGAWIDTDLDGTPDLHTSGAGDEGPEIYCGRMIAHNLTCELGQDEVSLIIRYLNKVHDYRQGLATTNVTACLYTDDDWAWWHTDYYTRCGYAWADREEYYDKDETIAWDYKQKIQTPYEYMRLGCHSWSGGHAFSTPSGSGGTVYSSDLVYHPPNVLFYNLYACSNARWTNSNCMGVWYTMSGAGLGAVGSTKTGSMNNGEWFYRPIGQFYPIGYSVESWFDSFQPYDNGERSWTFGMLWLGDPTLWRSRVAPGEFALTSPLDSTQFSSPNVLLEWEASTPAGVYETVTYTLIVDNNKDFCSPELVVEGLPETSYQISPSDGLVGLMQHWKVEAVTNFGKSTASTNTRTFTIAIDSDYDGMADDWESANGLDPSDPTDALRDADGDRVLNREEYEFESDPQDADSPAFVYVDDDSAGDPAQDGTFEHPYESIQTAIDAATPPAVVKVLPGTYAEKVVMTSEVWVIGSGAAETMMIGPDPGPVVMFYDVVNGLLAGVKVTSDPAGVLLRSKNSTLKVRNCVLTGANNGFGIAETGSVEIVNCLLADNAGHGIWAGFTAGVKVTNCTFANNATTGAYFCGSGLVVIEDSIFWGNGDDLTISGHTPISVMYCDIGDGDFAGSNGNISTDPLFIAGPLHDYYLSQLAAGQASDSPCVDTGSEPAAYPGMDRLTTRTDGIRDTGTVDMGCHAAYALRIDSISGSSDVTIHWNAQPGLSYVVEWSEDRETWHEVDAGEVTLWTDEDIASYACKYYRVREK